MPITSLIHATQSAHTSTRLKDEEPGAKTGKEKQRLSSAHMTSPTKELIRHCLTSCVVI